MISKVINAYPVGHNSMSLSLRAEIHHEVRPLCLFCFITMICRYLLSCLAWIQVELGVIIGMVSPHRCTNRGSPHVFLLGRVAATSLFPKRCSTLVVLAPLRRRRNPNDYLTLQATSWRST
jgi:hypothetical protein